MSDLPVPHINVGWATIYVDKKGEIVICCSHHANPKIKTSDDKRHIVIKK